MSYTLATISLSHSLSLSRSSNPTWGLGHGSPVANDTRQIFQIVPALAPLVAHDEDNLRAVMPRLQTVSCDKLSKLVSTMSSNMRGSLCFGRGSGQHTCMLSSVPMWRAVNTQESAARPSSSQRDELCRVPTQSMSSGHTPGTFKAASAFSLATLSAKASSV